MATTTHKRVVIQVIEDDGTQTQVMAEGHWDTQTVTEAGLQALAEELANGSMCGFDCDICHDTGEL